MQFWNTLSVKNSLLKSDEIFCLNDKNYYHLSKYKNGKNIVYILYTYIYIYIYIYTHQSIYTYTYMYMYVYIYTYMYAYIYIYISKYRNIKYQKYQNRKMQY